MNEVREIVTKAVVAKGKKAMHITHNMQTDAHPYSILGCWIINNEFDAMLKDDVVEINGNFEVNIWYSKEGNSKTDVLRENVSYRKDIKVKRIVNDPLKSTDDIIARILKHPTVSNAKIVEDGLILDIDIEILAEVIGETKMQVTVFNQVTNDDDIEDLDIEVNDDFLSK